MLHREHRRRRSGGDADLRVRVLQMAVGGLCRNAQAVADLLRLESAGHHGDHLSLAIGQAGRVGHLRHRLPCRLQDGGDRVGIQATRPAGGDERFPGRLRRHGRSVRSGLGHRVVRICGGDHLGRHGDHRARQTTVISTSVDSLVMSAGDRGELGQRGGRC